MADYYDEGLVGAWKGTETYREGQRVVKDVAAAKSERKLVYEAVLNGHTGDAYPLKPGQIIRLEQRHEVTQVCDWLFITPDLSDWSSYGSTGAFQGLFPELGYQFLGLTGRMKSLAVMVSDEAPDDFAKPGWANHFSQWHCSPEWQEILYPDPPNGTNACHINFVHGLNRIPAMHDIKDIAERRRIVNMLANNHNFQTFQVCHHDVGDDQTIIRLGGSPQVPHGAGVEFFANTDLYAVISNCPGADITAPIWDGKEMRQTYPVYISVWDSGVEPVKQPEWKDWDGKFYEMADGGGKDLSPRTAESFQQNPHSGPSGEEFVEYGAYNEEQIRIARTGE